MNYLGVSLKEICEVNSHPLNEEQLWSILHIISNYKFEEKTINNTQGQSALHYVITPHKVLVLPCGSVIINNDEGDTNHILFCTPTMIQKYMNHPNYIQDSLVLYSLSLTILWCANYGNRRNQVPEISLYFQQFLNDMNDQKLSLENINQICLNHTNMKRSKCICSNLCTSILGDISVQISSHISKFTEDNPTEQNTNVFENNETKSKTEIKKGVNQFQKSFLSEPGSLRTIPLNATSSGQSLNIMVYLDNLSRVKVCCGGIDHLKVMNITKVVVGSLSSDIDDYFFGLATWVEGEFQFLDNSSKLECLAGFPDNLPKLYLRILFFPPTIQTLEKSLLKALYLQLRTDLIHDRMISLNHETLSVEALAMQCELGDYQQHFGKEYVNLEEFLSSRMIKEIGRSRIYSQLLLLHRQLAGIDEDQAMLMFLRRCQQMHEYGMHFYKLYHKPDCYDQWRTWLGIGPRGITLFDICDESVRIRKHVFRWNEMKTISLKENCIILTKLYPKVRFKFYRTNKEKSRYIVSMVEKLHQFYARQSLPDIFSPIAVFDDITEISVSSKHNLKSNNFVDEIIQPNITSEKSYCDLENKDFFIYEYLSNDDNKSGQMP